jgi:hypothetical protein
MTTPPGPASRSHRTPSLVRIVKTDWLALAGAIVPIVGVVIAVASVAGVLPDRSRSLVHGKLETVPAQPVDVAALLAVGFVVVGVALLAWRIRTIRSSFATGHRVEGTITKLRPFKDRAYVHYAYRLQGTMQEVTHFVHQTAAYRRLAEGQAVSIALDPLRPRSGFVAELFEDAAAE